MTIKQYVNLTKNIAALDSEIESEDRCGELTVDLTAEKADSAVMYKAKVTAVGSDNVKYNRKEMKRNPNFRFARGITGVVDEKKIRIQDIKIPAAGGNKYKIEAKDPKGNVVSTHAEVEVWRKLYYQPIVMDAGQGDPETTTTAYSLADRAADLEPYFVKLIQAGADQKMKFIKTLHEDVMDEFYDAAEKAYTLDRERKLRGFAAVFSNFITDPEPYIFRRIVMIGRHDPMCRWDADYVYLAGDYHLWYGLDDEHDRQQHYLASDLNVTHTAAQGARSTVTVSKRDIEPYNKTDTYGGYTDLKVRITPALQQLLNQTNGRLRFRVRVNIVAGWTLGFRVPLDDGVEIVTVARRFDFRDAPRGELPNTWNHEIGHRLGMVAYGNKDHRASNPKFQYRPWTPDAPATLYGENRGINNQGHMGPHCSNGATYHMPGTPAGGKHGVWTGQPLCVMFGADATNTGGKAPKNFCPLCKPIVRKLDLSLPPTRKTHDSV